MQNLDCERCNVPLTDKDKTLKTSVKFDLKTRKLCQDCYDFLCDWIGPQKINAEYGSGKVSNQKETVFLYPNCHGAILVIGRIPNSVFCKGCKNTLVITKP